MNNFIVNCVIILIVINIFTILANGLLSGSHVLTIPANTTKLFAVYDSADSRTPVWVRFVTVGLHSHRHNLTLFKPNDRKSITGRNVGLVLFTGVDSGLVHIHNPNGVDVNALVVTDQHVAYDPIPGGCSLEFPLKVSPFLRLYENQYFNRLEYQYASIGSAKDLKHVSCEKSQSDIEYNIYGYFLREGDYTEKEYFRAITLMSNISDISNQGSKLMNTTALRKYLYAYTGRPVVYNIIATSRQFSSAYVPIVTYDCGNDSIEHCGKHDMTTIFLTSMMGLMGVFVCFRGHLWFQLQMLFFGLIDGSFIAYLLLIKYTELNQSSIRIYTSATGTILALVWLAVWKILRQPLLSLVLTGLSLGFLLMATLLFTTIGNLELFQNDINYWLIMSCAAILVTLFFPMVNPVALSVVSSSIVGSYVAVIAVDHYIYGSLSYIIINVIKRADYSLSAYNTVPFQNKDIIMAVIWLLLSLTGIVLQMHYSTTGGQSRGPFPSDTYCHSHRHQESLERYYRRRSQYEPYDSTESQSGGRRRRSRRSRRWEPVPDPRSYSSSGRLATAPGLVVDERSALLQHPYYTGTSNTTTTTATINPYNDSVSHPGYGGVSAPPLPDSTGRISPPPDYNHLYITNTNGREYQSL